MTAELQAKQFAVERAKINLLRSQVAGDAKKLFELDLQDSEASLGAAQSDVDRFQAIAKQNPSAISQYEIRRAELILEKAKINVARAKARLESAAEQRPLEDAPQFPTNPR